MGENKKYSYVRVEAIDALGRKLFSQPFFPEDDAPVPNVPDSREEWFNSDFHRDISVIKQF